MKTLLLSAALALLAGFAPRADAQIPLPKLEARVTDLTGTLTAAQQSSLEDKLAAFEARKGAQIAVLILPTTQPEDIAQFGVRLLESWKLGRKGVDDGAALIVAKDDRAVRIEVQYGLEGVLTDALTSRIINDTIVPLFGQGDFYGGINAGVDQVLRVVEGESLPAVDQNWKGSRGIPSAWIYILIAVAALSGLVGRIIGRTRGAGIAGLFGAYMGWRYFSVWWGALVGFGAVFLFALMYGARMGGGYGGGRVFRDAGRSGGWGGGSSGGGWSGGGGRGGGGGATGRW